MAKKPFSSYQVLQAWLETQIGSARHLRPQGYEMPGEGGSAWGETCARAAAIVEGLPLYGIVRRQLIEFCQVGLDELGLIGEFMAGLDEALKDCPFYPTYPEDREQEARTPVVWVTCAEAAEILGCTRQWVRELVSDGVLKQTITYRRHLQIQKSEVESYRRSVRSRA